ncbi:MAG: hypothetical protein OEV93_03405 [Candidatus Moranbacteria bacterium]|nr:hypothetical protein [Candidatus Moranbacteria bacterium]
MPKTIRIFANGQAIKVSASRLDRARWTSIIKNKNSKRYTCLNAACSTQIHQGILCEKCNSKTNKELREKLQKETRKLPNKIFNLVQKLAAKGKGAQDITRDIQQRYPAINLPTPKQIKAAISINREHRKPRRRPIRRRSRRVQPSA